MSQGALIDQVVEQFNQQDAHTIDVLMVASLQLQRPDKTIPWPANEVAWAECTPYQSLIGSLMYIVIGTCLDISYTVGRLASFLDCYGPEHWEVAIQVLCYLNGTRSFCLRLGGTAPLQLVGYSDSDYTNCVKNC
jgi:hypothetical protein